jgi:hypothetical protein
LSQNFLTPEPFVKVAKALAAVVQVLAAVRRVCPSLHTPLPALLPTAHVIILNFPFAVAAFLTIYTVFAGANSGV